MREPMDDDGRESDGSLTSLALAELIVDALHDARIVGESDLVRAIKIATEEIDVRKALGDY
jgi:hypothetical protein